MPPAGGTRTQISVRFSSEGQGTGMFSPGVALTPIAEEPVRSWDFPVNVNRNLVPRAYEPFGFPALRAFANVELVRLAIETRKDQIDGLDWAIKPRQQCTVSPGAIDRLTAFWRKPDGRTHFAGFMRKLVDDLLVIDAPSMERLRTRGGAFRGLRFVDGATIHPMVDETGEIPDDPDAIAYQQVIKGRAWTNLTQRDLLYVPRNVRPGHIYGYAPVEQVIVTINTIIRRQAAQLSHFTESNVPAGLLNAPDGWTLTQIQDLQQWFDDKIAGNAAEQSRVLWGPSGSSYQAFKDAPIKDEFDEWLARIVAYAFSLPPTPFVRQMNKGTADEDQERALEEGLEPIKLWAKRWIDQVIEEDLGEPGAEFVWLDTPAIDAEAQARIDDINLRNGSATLDQVRHARGDPAYPNGLGTRPLVYTGAGPVPLADALAPAPSTEESDMTHAPTAPAPATKG